MVIGLLKASVEGLVPSDTSELVLSLKLERKSCRVCCSAAAVAAREASTGCSGTNGCRTLVFSGLAQ